MHTDYGTSDRIAEIQAIAEKRISRIPKISWPAAPSLYVKEGTACSWGMSGTELRRLSEAAHFLNRLGLPLWYAVLAAHDLTEFETRELLRKFKSTLVLYQHRAGLESQYWLEAIEGAPTVHSNILFPLPANAAHHINSLRRSTVYGAYINIQNAKGTDWFVNYTSKERTPQAHFASRGRLGPRRSGPHPLGDGGGDRVRMSKHRRLSKARQRFIATSCFLCRPTRRIISIVLDAPRFMAHISTFKTPRGQIGLSITRRKNARLKRTSRAEEG